MIDKGKVIATGTPDELKAKVSGQVLAVTPADPATGNRGHPHPDGTAGSGPISPDSAAVTARCRLRAGAAPVRELDEAGIAIGSSRCASQAWMRSSWR